MKKDKKLKKNLLFKKKTNKMNIDVEIYLNKIINFFENNPNDLSDLIGEINKNRFYEEIKTTTYINFNEKKEVELTRNQLIEIVLKLTKNSKKNPFLITKNGIICLN